MTIIQKHAVILFQGDSITDTGRSRYTIGPNNPDGLGYGYSRLVADRLLEEYPDHHLQIYNRGVSGDRIRDLAQRWERDSLRLQPDLISIMIGVNDTWNYLYLGMGADPGEYRTVFQSLLEQTRAALPDVRFVLCEPFVLITGEVTSEWMDDVLQRQEMVRELSREFQAVYVPFQASLDESAEKIPPHRLLEDGVHPTEQGHRILAETWLNNVLGINK